MKFCFGITATAFLILSLTVTFEEGQASAETEHVEDVLKTHVIKKRNAWWSKKAVNINDESDDQSVARYDYLQRQALLKPTPAELVCYKERCLTKRMSCEESWISKLLNDCQTKSMDCFRTCVTRTSGIFGPEGSASDYV